MLNLIIPLKNLVLSCPQTLVDQGIIAKLTVVVTKGTIFADQLLNVCKVVGS